MLRRSFPIALLCLAGCSWFATTPVHKPWLPMLEPAELGRSVAALQKVSGSRDGNEYVLLFQLEVDSQRLAMVGSTVGGNTLFSLEYHGGNLNTSVSPLVPAQVDPAWVLADLQLAFWPQSAVENGLAQSQFRLQYAPGSRELYHGLERLIRVEYSAGDPWSGPVLFKNYKFDYEYRIETLQQEALPNPRDTDTLVF